MSLCKFASTTSEQSYRVMFDPRPLDPVLSTSKRRSLHCTTAQVVTPPLWSIDPSEQNGEYTVTCAYSVLVRRTRIPGAYHRRSGVEDPLRRTSSVFCHPFLPRSSVEKCWCRARRHTEHTSLRAAVRRTGSIPRADQHAAAP